MPNSPAGDYYAAAIAVLKSCGRPLSTRELTEEALGRGLIHPKGKTPAATMAAMLYTRIVDDPACPIERVRIEGQTRARRGTVQWRLRPK